MSKVLFGLLLPTTWIVILLIVAIFVKSNITRKKILTASVLLILVFTNSFLFRLLSNSWNVAPPPANGKKYSCVIVLGGFGSTDKYKNGFFNQAANRFIQGVELLSNGTASHILITGGNASLIPNGFSEGEWSRTQLKQLNIPDSVILIEGKSRNTIENARFTKQILMQKKLPPPYLLVTSDYHMRRALMIFKKTGLDVIPSPVEGIAPNANFFDSITPDYYTLLGWNGYIKEIVGYVVNYFMTGH